MGVSISFLSKNYPGSLYTSAEVYRSIDQPATKAGYKQGGLQHESCKTWQTSCNNLPYCCTSEGVNGVNSPLTFLKI